MSASNSTKNDQQWHQHVYQQRSGVGSNGCVCIHFLLDQYIGLTLYWEANILVLFIPYDYYYWVFKSISELFDDQFIILDDRKIIYGGFNFVKKIVFTNYPRMLFASVINPL